MNALKNILFFGLLFAVLCGVYFSMRPQPEQPLPAGLDPNIKPPTVEIPDISGPPANGASGPDAGKAAVITSPPKMNRWPSDRAEAPPFRPRPNDARDHAADHPALPHQDGLANAQPNLPSTPASLPPPPDMPPPPDTRSDRNYPSGVRDPFASESSAVGRNEIARATQVSLPGPPSEDHVRTSSIDTIRQQVALKIQENKLADALLLLTPLQDNPDVPKNEASHNTEILDYLAAKVIYSREHLLERPYGVQPGDTMDSIAEHFKVPALLLARINGIDQQNLRPGKELKVLAGPFSAHVSTERAEMKLMLDGRYAGRFPTTLSSDLQHVTGLYKVQAKSLIGANGSPTKPQWIELANTSGKIGIEAPPDARGDAARRRSTISMSEQDMDDVYGILSVGSVVIIQR
jgi:LysM repeat protein